MGLVKLNSLPVELLEQISQFWTGEMLVRMYLTGNKNLINRMCSERGVRRIVYEDRVLHRFPPIFAQFQNLRQLQFNVPGYDSLYYQGSFLLPYVPPSLEILELPFSRSVGMLSVPTSKEEYGPDLFDPTVRLPNLRVLVVQEVPTRWTLHRVGWIAARLPDTLIRLKCTSEVFDDTEEEGIPTHQFFTKLPSELEILEIETKFYKPTSDFTWPPNLTCLRLPCSTWYLHSNQLPPTLTELSLALNFSSPYLLNEEALNWKNTFRNLKILKTKTHHTRQLFEILSGLSLETLSLQNPISASDLANLPVSLQSLTASFAEPTSPFTLYAQLPSSLTSFEMTWNSTKSWCINNVNLSKLPQSLKNLNITNCGILKAKYIPLLPKSLTRCPLLNSAGVSRESIASLPRNLKELIFQDRKVRLPISDLDIALIPRELQVLKFENAESALSDPAIRNLPRKLTTLVHLTNTSFSGFGLAFLPSTLRILHLPMNSTISNSTIGKLPITLVELVIMGDERILTSACFKLLPPLMERLYIKFLGGLSDKDLLDLPTSLKAINIPSSRLTCNCLSFFPSNIQRITLRNNKSITHEGLRKVPANIKMLCIPGNDYLSGRRPGTCGYQIYKEEGLYF